MEPIPVPSPIHYELLLRLLERQTLPAIALGDRDLRDLREQVQAIIVMLRKAQAMQRQFQDACDRKNIATSPRWSLNETEALPYDGFSDDRDPHIIKKY